MIKNEHKFLVTIKLKQGNKITNQQAKEYILDAIQSYRGCYDPDGPEYELNPEQFKVKTFYQG